MRNIFELFICTEEVTGSSGKAIFEGGVHVFRLLRQGRSLYRVAVSEVKIEEYPVCISIQS